jgi:hypothetical protein
MKTIEVERHRTSRGIEQACCMMRSLEPRQA